ncbi:MAG: TolC family protein [Acidobacteria bacterium]|nr:TolC family protein [Acidobacteriota bacterium]
MKATIESLFVALTISIILPAALYAEEASAPARAMNLRDAIDSALERNENIIIERESLDSAIFAIDGARGAYDPLLRLDLAWRSATTPVNSSFSGAPEGELAPENETTEAGASLSQLLGTGGSVSVLAGSSRATTDGEFAFLSPAYEARFGVELRQPLLRDRTIDSARLSVRASQADRDRAEGALRREVSQTIADVERAYWIFVATRRAITVQEDAVALASKQLDDTMSRIESGVAPETEAAQPRAELERRRGDLLATKEAAARAETALKRLILGDDTSAWSERLEPVEDITVEVQPIDAASEMDRALASRPELDVVDGTIARRKLESDFADDRIRPALDLVLSYDRFGLAGSPNAAGSGIPGLPGDVPADLEGNVGDAFGQLTDGDFDDARVALQLSVPIGNRSARAGAEIARNALAQAEAERTRVRKAIRAEVLDAVAATETAGARIDAARAAREAAEVQLMAEKERYDAGLSITFLVLTRQNDLAAARLAEIRALTDYRTARTELARATGSLLQERGIELE